MRGDQQGLVQEAAGVLPASWHQPLLLLAAIIYAGKLANHHTTPKPLGDVREKLMQNAIEDAHVLMDMVAGTEKQVSQGPDYHGRSPMRRTS